MKVQEFIHDIKSQINYINFLFEINFAAIIEKLNLKKRRRKKLRKGNAKLCNIKSI